MNEAYIFNMISRTSDDRLPECSFYVDGDNYTVIFYGSLDELSRIPLRLDVAIGDNILIGDAKQVKIQKNHVEYEAIYSAYAFHKFEGSIPS